MTEQEKSIKVLKAEERVKKAQADLKRAKADDKKALRKSQDRHKYMMGGCIAKYFPECFEFDEREMNRIIACAFKNSDIKNMIAIVVKERKGEEKSE